MIIKTFFKRMREKETILKYYGRINIFNHVYRLPWLYFSDIYYIFHLITKYYLSLCINCILWLNLPLMCDPRIVLWANTSQQLWSMAQIWEIWPIYIYIYMEVIASGERNEVGAWKEDREELVLFCCYKSFSTTDFLKSLHELFGIK